MSVSTPLQSGSAAADALSSPSAMVVLAQARMLKRDALAGCTHALLRGKNFGLVCESADGADAQLFRRAATELGAHVAHVRPVLTEASTAQDVRHTARLLGRLYDAVECQGMPPELVRRVAADCGVPVFDHVGGEQHPLAPLADMLGGDGPAEDNRRFVLQAVLLNAVA